MRRVSTIGVTFGVRTPASMRAAAAVSRWTPFVVPWCSDRFAVMRYPSMSASTVTEHSSSGVQAQQDLAADWVRPQPSPNNAHAIAARTVDFPAPEFPTMAVTPFGSNVTSRSATDRMLWIRTRVMRSMTGPSSGLLAGCESARYGMGPTPVSYTHLRAHETDSYLVCRL